MSCRSSEKYTAALEIGEASISMSLGSMVFRSVSARGGAGRCNEPAQCDGHGNADHLLHPGPLQQTSVHGRYPPGGHHEPDAALQRDAMDSGVLHELDGHDVGRDAAG